ncbi:two-component regulator propeller domain-containing protein [Flavihumibacter sp. ZG627]|uniref:type IX secretion system anionic LPS delivery protein PorZ n=1 Tax=Flavihumibacter sp. ZG627 TaxID=1463156 RepID=UPI00057FCE7C|nr:two-component regulator propeller domain-containing protein [Flavihumibacter sp. ZG627]KIC89678.1 hypothetical protein HY58_14995 [Flavihumibacter sp. ZG627]
MRFFLFCVSFLFLLVPQLFCQPIGRWQEHFPFGNAIALTSNADKLFVATPYALFSVDASKEMIERYSKVSGLSETGISAIFGNTREELVIAYNNSNIDILRKGGITNMNALARAPINGDKTIYHISSDGDRVLLSTGFAVVVLNIKKNEIGDTWVIRNGGVYTKVNATASDEKYYYAATTAGLKRTLRQGINQADYRNWEMLSGTGGLPGGSAERVFVIDGILYVQHGPNLYMSENYSSRQIYTDDWSWNAVNYSEGKFIISQQKSGRARVILLDKNGILQTIAEGELLTDPRDALIIGSTIWIADSKVGLLEYKDGLTTSIIPNSPQGIPSGEIYANGGEWWMGRINGMDRFYEGNWTNYNADGQTLPTNTGAITPVIKDRAERLWAGTERGGLIFRNGEQFTIIKEPLISPDKNDPLSYRVTGLAADADNNLWISNSGVENQLVMRYPDATYRKFKVPFTLNGDTVGRILLDEHNQKWIISPGGNGLLCFNHGLTIDNTGDDQWRYYRAGSGNGNLPSNEVLSIALDDFGFIWVGTADGIAIIQCTAEVFSSQGCEALIPVVQSDNFAGFLFKGESVQAIAVDGANRKWIGTRNGVWLISADGEKTIQRFTTSNSPLPDNDIKSITIDHRDGTVLFATANGLCSYKSDVTGAQASGSDVLVYPNPVPPGYNGTIAIRGVPANAVVKITELNGRLVQQGKALGTQYTWNGRDLNGRKISTGVYLVLASSENRAQQVLTRIIFIQR